ncbi:hypothetical protein JVU11DRAFT_4003 [Chiua virens]|nr:hypothetical protein JVU11DRAFT_4003 [Chiua virens]
MATEPHVVLWGVPKKPDDPSPSGFCQKLENFLRYSKISYELRDTYPFRAPKGKVPYADITHGGKTVTIPDSHFIIQYLVENDLIKDPDELAGLTAAQRGESRAFEAYIEEVLYPAVVYDRWYIEENYAVTEEEIFKGISWPMPAAPGVVHKAEDYRSVVLRRNGATFARRRCIVCKRKRSTHSRSSMPSTSTFHGGERPSHIDLTVHAFLANMLSTAGNPYIVGLIMRALRSRRLSVR